MTAAVAALTFIPDKLMDVMEELRDLESFLKHVDTISDLVQGLQCAAEDAAAEARADRCLAALEAAGEDGEEEGCCCCKTKINRTTINTNPASLSDMAPC